ncbi:MAG TPA: universal stress protein [Nitrosopumilaceae archaeon]|nr:universal stress protein [Nitrosopumilaceae archaeon]
MVQKINNILVPLDGSKDSIRGLDKAISIAKQSDGVITGINVVTVAPTLASSVINYKKFLTKKAEEMLDSAKKNCEKQDVKFSSKILYGSPASKIAEFAEKEKFDVVVVGSRGIGGIKGAILGSVANTIVHKSKVSVLIVK